MSNEIRELKALAAVRGAFTNALPQLCADHLVRAIQDHPDVLYEAAGGGALEQGDWDRIVSEVAAQSDIMQMYREHQSQADESTALKKTPASWAEMQKLRPEERMRIAREGK